ncbi:hypothetical protein OAF98_04185 [Planctomicrobium sp.]|jgi:hypothetical protein|nr:hypothetical protein [Planctomicrobium sp.]MDB4731320.1 hypothetical protein [bacterium]MDB4743663.1 hypothetical protein [Planctomicrobium sp.]
MLKNTLLAGLCVLAFVLVASIGTGEAEASPPGQPNSWQRFYYYPYVYYPHNFQTQPESYDHLYYRYPQERRIPVYNTDWHNFYPKERPYHSGHHFRLDVF